MKKYLSFLMLAMIAFSLSSCFDKGGDSSEGAAEEMGEQMDGEAHHEGDGHGH